MSNPHALWNKYGLLLCRVHRKYPAPDRASSLSSSPFFQIIEGWQWKVQLRFREEKALYFDWD